jgi:chromosomal replication initiation ATPase DnaA
MSPLELDPRFTFDSFVVGPANRLASAASRRVAELPGAAYNPLFLYSASGLGKTHLITAIGHHARRLHPSLRIVYDTLGPRAAASWCWPVTGRPARSTIWTIVCCRASPAA